MNMSGQQDSGCEKNVSPRSGKALELGKRIAGIKRVSLIGLYINICLAVLKIAAGIFGNSRAVVADGVHSITDCLSSVGILLGVRYWAAPADAGHPYGHQRLESLISLGLGLLLGFMGLGIIWDSLNNLLHPEPHAIKGILPLGAALASIATKEWLYRWTLRKGAALHSESVEASAWDHRSDALSSIPTAIAVAGAMWFPRLGYLDFAGALLVAAFIIYAAWKICIPACDTLLDKSAPSETRKAISQLVREVPGVRGVHRLRTRYLGPCLQVDVHILVDSRISVAEGHAIADAVEKSLCAAGRDSLNGENVCDALAHVDPWVE